MLVIRPAKSSDVDAIAELAKLTGTGLTTLPKTPEQIKERIEISNEAFAKSLQHPQDEYYLFVMEDTETGKAVGTSGLVSRVGLSQPFYTYKVGRVVHASPELGIYNEIQTLYLGNDYTGASEICTLFLSPDYRKGHNGRLLSKSRFLFLAQFPERFSERVIAEMRGVSDEEGRSPFWDSLGRRFFSMDFAEADALSGEGSNQFIAELMPKYPIYTALLSDEAQAVIGEVHNQTKPAVKILKAEGFRYRGYIDIFDAGPTLEVSRDRIRTAAESNQVTLAAINNGPSDSDSPSSNNCLIANTSLQNFRVTAAPVTPVSKAKVSISAESAEALQVKPGDQLRISPII